MSKGSPQQSPKQRKEAHTTPTPRGKLSSAHDLSGPPSEEDEFFARGDTFPPASFDTEPDHLESIPPPPPTPQMLERRARLRRLVGTVVGAATLLTGVVGAKALVRHSERVAVSDSSLAVSHKVMPSIALNSAPESAAAKSAAAPRTNENSAAGSPADEAPAAQAENAPSAPVENPAPAAQAENAAPGAAADNNAGAGTAAEKPADKAEPNAKAADTPVARKLPVIDIEIPSAPDAATDEQWANAARSLSSKDFKGADQAFAELGKRTDPATREAARLARAVWWISNGKKNEVKPVIADLAANATTPSVRQRARELGAN